jgi:hypothetical protein
MEKLFWCIETLLNSSNDRGCEDEWEVNQVIRLTEFRLKPEPREVQPGGLFHTAECNPIIVAAIFQLKIHFDDGKLIHAKKLAIFPYTGKKSHSHKATAC